MSGLEFAGLALAILPLVLSTIKSYDDVLSPFIRYKNYAREAKVYSKELSIQRTIFRNGCRNLLEEVVDHDAASIMLNSLTRESWYNNQLDAQLSQQLGDSMNACINILELVETQLQDIDGENQHFTATVEEERKVILTKSSIKSKADRTLRPSRRI